jgi:cytochrome bd-type quinol oxidase subunit 2
MSTHLETAPPRFTKAPRSDHRFDHHAIAHAVREAAIRGTIAVGLAGVAVIHAVDSVGKWSEVPYMFWMYMALIVGALAVAGAVLFTRSRAALAAAILVAASAFVGYVLSRTTGLPNATDDIGNWTEPLGLASLVVEGCVVAVALAALRAIRPST